MKDTARKGDTIKRDVPDRMHGPKNSTCDYVLQDGENNNPCAIVDLDIFAKETVEAVTGQAVQMAAIGLTIDPGRKDASHDVIRGVREEWAWLMTCNQCVATHLDHSARYHEFYCHLDDCDASLKRFHGNLYTSFSTADLRGDVVDVHDIIAEMKNVLLAYTLCQTRIEKLSDMRKHVYPLRLRHVPLSKPRDARMLCNYKQRDGAVAEGELVKLLDNSEHMWKIRTATGRELHVPALTVTIPPPCDDASDAGNRIVMQLLTTWRTSVKRLTRQILTHLLLVFSDWDELKVSSLKRLSAAQRRDLVDLCDAVESVMQTWSVDDDLFTELKSRLSRLRLILADESDDTQDEENSCAVVVQIALVRRLLAKYQDFCDYWVAYSHSAETMTPKTRIVRSEANTPLPYFISAYYYYKYYDTNIRADGEKDLLVGDVGNIVCDETDFIDDPIELDEMLVLSECPDEALEKTTYSEVNVTRSSETTETDRIDSSVEEDQTTFVIQNVLDPRSNNRVGLEEAISSGIYDPVRKVHRNPDNDYEMCLADALNSGKISVAFKTATKIREKKSVLGLITIRTTKETRPYEIIHVVNPFNEKRVTLQEAIDGGFYNEDSGEYVTNTGERMSVINAIDSGCIHVKYSGHGDEAQEVKNITYAVHAVFNQLRRANMSFVDAVKLQLVDRETGAYYNNLTGERIPVSDAIKCGFIKAYVVDDDKGLNIDRKNSIVIDQTQRVKDNLFESVRLERAMKTERR